MPKRISNLETIRKLVKKKVRAQLGWWQWEEVGRSQVSPSPSDAFEASSIVRTADWPMLSLGSSRFRRLADRRFAERNWGSLRREKGFKRDSPVKRIVLQLHLQAGARALAGRKNWCGSRLRAG